MLFDVRASERYPRRVLLALGGLSPQVVTETLYSLCIKRDPPFVPTEVHLLTTTAGRSEAIDGLLDDDGEFHEFLRDYNLEGQIAFSTEHLHPLLDRDGHHLTDVRSEADNIAAADAITERIRSLTLDPQCALHVSISGGRNTLGFYLGYALSMFGRPQDRLSHVLVPKEFEDNDQFYYPPPEPEIILTRKRKPISTEHAHITLAEIPYVSLRHGLPKQFLEGKASYSQTVEAIRRSFSPPELVISLKDKKLWCGGIEVDMPPQPLAFYIWLAKERTSNAGHGGLFNWRHVDPKGFLNVYRSLVGSMAHDYEITEKMMTDGMPKTFFDEKKSRVNSWLVDYLGEPGAKPYLIVSSGSRPTTRYGLGLDAGQITFK